MHTYVDTPISIHIKINILVYITHTTQIHTYLSLLADNYSLDRQYAITVPIPDHQPPALDLVVSVSGAYYLTCIYA